MRRLWHFFNDPTIPLILPSIHLILISLSFYCIFVAISNCGVGQQPPLSCCVCVCWLLRCGVLSTTLCSNMFSVLPSSIFVYWCLHSLISLLLLRLKTLLRRNNCFSNLRSVFHLSHHMTLNILSLCWLMPFPTVFSHALLGLSVNDLLGVGPLSWGPGREYGMSCLFLCFGNQSWAWPYPKSAQRKEAGYTRTRHCGIIAAKSCFTLYTIFRLCYGKNLNRLIFLMVFYMKGKRKKPERKNVIWWLCYRTGDVY